MNQTERRLAGLLARHSVLYRPDRPFRLASGKTSDFYFDCRRTTMLPEAMPLIGRLIFRRIRGKVEAVGGMTMGADPIACAVAYTSALRKEPLPAFSVRKAAKSHGTGQWIEGALPAGARVAVVEDVVTTGGSTLEAIERCRSEGLRVRQVVAIVDREAGGMDRIRAAIEGGDASALFTRTEIDAIWRETGDNARS